MSQLPPASREEVAAMLGDVDESYVERVLDTAASLDEIGEAIDELEGRYVEPRHVPSSIRVAQVHEILDELFNATETPRIFPLRGDPVGNLA